MLTDVMIRKHQVQRLAAEHAMALPLLASGYWFHKDVRDNFYFAIHLFGYTAEGAPDWTEAKRVEGQALAVRMLQHVLKLQMQDASHPMYGHWPLNLGSDPASAKPHVLPVELMGCMLMFFYEKYREALPAELKSEISLSILHIYQSSVYRHPLKSMHHHEAKHTALKLLLGHEFGDEALLEEGIRCAQRLLQHVRTFGFKEYGCLPWHWHWIQAFTCVWDTVQDEAARAVAGELLDYLWSLRAEAYLRGTWVGPHSRIWPHDAPKDTNTPLDYIAFGDFPAPNTFPRLEGAALYTYEVSAAVRERAMAQAEPREVKRLIRFAAEDGEVTSAAHTYTYVTRDYALGGIYERREEFDNEQLRWDVSLPLDSEPAAAGVNQLYFFHPGSKYAPGDDRHASPYGEVLFDRGASLQLWAIPEEAAGEAFDSLVGCLPKGEWRFDKFGGCGKLGSVYAAFHAYGGEPVAITEKADRYSVAVSLEEGRRAGIIVEVMSTDEADAQGVHNLDDWLSAVRERFSNAFKPQQDSLAVSYPSIRGKQLHLAVGNDGLLTSRNINGTGIAFDDYTIF
ncbi:hypothetical protein ACFQI7_23240 [Paenibacillus allorhizosphaerae]|uniref:Heparin-sulfate lyase N-terminal domain-containing protein n=1 Tax=Paenibacillus allorhizosphaerae TaxID=2849866 RepID=A0ABM8VJU4_9BACL|nr:hypothetical protein [Paenibacillus allorhizosphaerae]CAG7646061.1 hypothetical protein PAECIP111802_03649 [Paenibacillus allorhizosphaerae]